MPVLSTSNRPDTCDSLHVINLASDVVSIAAVYFFRGISYLTLHIYLAACHYGHVAAIRIFLTNCYGITNLLLRKFTFTENQTFLRNFYTTKIWSHTVPYTIKHSRGKNFTFRMEIVIHGKLMLVDIYC